MKVLVISDVHGYVEQLRALKESVNLSEFDFAVCCGDLESSEVVDELANLGIEVYAVPGNMDSYYILDMLEYYVLSIHGKVIRRKGVVLAGIGGLTPSTALNKVLSELNVVDLKGSKLMIISHYPPFGTKVDLAYARIHIGLEEISDLIIKLKPHVVTCGHVHEAYGTDRVDGTLVINPGPLAWGRYAILDLNKIEVVMKVLS